MGEQRKILGSSLIFCFLVATLINAEAVMATENSWASRAPLQEARSGLGVAVVNSKIYAIGGWGTSGICAFIEEYNPETDIWTFKTPMPTPRNDFGTAIYHNKIFCIGGNTPGFNNMGVNEVYDTETDTWETRRLCLQKDWACKQTL
jgi:N-acetylneuraminic acid mutarotase